MLNDVDFNVSRVIKMKIQFLTLKICYYLIECSVEYHIIYEGFGIKF